MKAGRLDRKITIQRKSTTQDAYGGEVETWAAIVHRHWAGYKPMGGGERFTAEQFVARQQVEWRVRHSSSLADLSPEDRIIYPAPADQHVQEPPASTIFEIISVTELGRREGLLIKTARRAEGA